MASTEDPWSFHSSAASTRSMRLVLLCPRGPCFGCYQGLSGSAPVAGATSMTELLSESPSPDRSTCPARNNTQSMLCLTMKPQVNQSETLSILEGKQRGNQEWSLGGTECVYLSECIHLWCESCFYFHNPWFCQMIRFSMGRHGVVTSDYWQFKGSHISSNKELWATNRVVSITAWCWISPWLGYWRSYEGPMKELWSIVFPYPPPRGNPPKKNSRG